jgi:hypothetical protein
MGNSRLHEDSPAPTVTPADRISGVQQKPTPSVPFVATQGVSNAAVARIMAAPRTEVINLPEIEIVTPVTNVAQGGPNAGQAEIEAQLTRIKDSTTSLWTNYQDGLDNFQTAMMFDSDQEAEFDIGAVLAAAGKEAFDKIVEEVIENTKIASVIIVLKEAVLGAFAEYERAELASEGRRIGAYISDQRTAASKARTGCIAATNATRSKLIGDYERALTESGGPSDDPHVLVGEPATIVNALRKEADMIEQRVLAADAWAERFIHKFAQAGWTGPISRGGRESGVLYLSAHVYRNGDQWTLKAVDDAWRLATSQPKIASRLATGLKNSLRTQGKPVWRSVLEKSISITVETEIQWGLNEYREGFVRFVENPNQAEFRGNWGPDVASAPWLMPNIRNEILSITNVEGWTP